MEKNIEQQIAEYNEQEKHATESAKECRESGMDDSFYEDHASWCRRQIYLLQSSGCEK